MALVPQALDDELCDLVLRLGDEAPGADGVVAREHGEQPTLDPTVRRVRQSVLPRTAASRSVYDRVAEVADECNRASFGFDVGVGELDEGLVLVDYGPGDFYNWHLDLGPAAPTRKLSISIVLSPPSDYAGGVLTFPGTTVDRPPRGTAVVFPGFLLHGVQPVTSGRRRALLAWMGGPRFR